MSNFDFNDAVKRTIADQHDRIAALEEQNVKLRELVKDMWPSYCWANTGYETFLTYEQDVAIRGRMRDLGVEVDE